MVINIYSFNISPFCRSVLMTAKLLKLDLNVINVDLSANQKSAELLKINPTHLIPTIVDEDFVLWESRAIMRYLCDKYQPNGTLYPRDIKKRAIVDRWLEFDSTLVNSVKNTLLTKKFLGVEPSQEKVKAFNKHIKLFDQLIGDNKYLSGDQLTIADISMLSHNLFLIYGKLNATEYPNFFRWITNLQTELPNFKEIYFSATKQQMDSFVNSSKDYFIRKLNE